MPRPNTSINYDSPDLVALRMEIMNCHPVKLSMSKDHAFEELAEAFTKIIIAAAKAEKVTNKDLQYEILEKSNKNTWILSDMTIRRLYGHKKEKDGVPKSMFEADTLDLFAIVGGYKSWDDYLNAKANPYGQYFSIDKIKPDLLEIGKLYVIGWYPHKYLKLLYLGNQEFRVIETNRRSSYPEDRIIKAESFKFEHIMDLDSFGYPLYPIIFYVYKGAETPCGL